MCIRIKHLLHLGYAPRLLFTMSLLLFLTEAKAQDNISPEPELLIDHVEKIKTNIELLSPYIDPFDETISLRILSHTPLNFRYAEMRLTDSEGITFERLLMKFRGPVYEVDIPFDPNTLNSFMYSLYIDGHHISTQSLQWLKSVPPADQYDR